MSKKNSINNQFNKIRDLMNKKTSKVFINLFKRDYLLSDISTNFNKIMEYPKLKNEKINNLYVNDERNLLIDEWNYNSNNIWFELSWTALILNKYKSKLKEFPKMKLDFENSILLKDFENASKILIEIESIFGKSIWVTRNKIILLQESEGIEAQKKYVNSLIENKDTSIPFKTLIYWFSISAEDNISSSYFDRRFEDFFSEMENENYKNYFNFKFQKFHAINEETLSYILIEENSSSIIDIYEIFIEILSKVVLLKIDYNSDFLIFQKIFKKLDKTIHDARFINLQRALGLKKMLIEEEKNIDIAQINEYYVFGKNKEAIDLSVNILLSNPSYLSLYKIYAESLIIENSKICFSENSLSYKIIDAYKNILLINDKTDESLSFLEKVVVTYSHLSFSKYIYTLLYDSIQDNYSYISKISFFHNSIVSLDKYEIYPSVGKSSYLEELKLSYPNLIFFKILVAYQNEDELIIDIIDKSKISSENKNKLLMQYYFYHKKYEKSKYFANQLLNSKNKISINEANKILLLILLEDENYEEVLEKTIELYFNNINSIIFLPILGVINKIITFIEDNQIWSDKIEASIIFYLSTIFRYHDDSRTRLEYLYEYYLTTHGYERPIELIKYYKDNDIIFNKEIIFYLKNICVPSIMEKSLYFKDIDEVENERIKICHFLKLKDEENKELYLQEIKDKEQNLFIRKESSRIKKNKIYVNIDEVKNLCAKELKDDYNRLLILMEASNYQKDSKIISIIDTLKDKTLQSKDISFEETLSTVYLYDLESTEVDKFFNSIIYQIKDIFIKNEHYGLDVYLSTKIRHGTISNQLRKPLEKEKLITLTGGESKEYQDNELFKNGIYKLDAQEQDYIQKEFKLFSFNHDKIIKELSHELLQVSTSIVRKDLEGKIVQDNNEKALFKYYFSTLETKYMLYSLSTKETSFEEFINFISKILWIKTDINLRKIRDVIKTKIKTDILKNFDSLQASLFKIEKDMSEINNSIARARTDMNSSIDNVISWFGRMEDSDVSDYVMDNALTIAQKAFNKEDEFCSIDNSISETYFKGSTLDKFVDIYFIVFDNAFKHSGFQDETKVQVQMLLNSENLNIIISNKVKNEISLEALNHKIKPIQDGYGTKEAISKINKEGKTGFNKIWKIISKDLEISEHQLDFEYKLDKNDIKFEIKIEMNVKELMI